MEETTKDLPKWLDPNDPDRTFAQRAAAPMLFIGVSAAVGGVAIWGLGKAVDRFSRALFLAKVEKALEEED